VIYPASTAPGELSLSVTYTLWIPEDIQTIRAVIVHQHGASIPAAQAGATAAYDLHWQALAKKWDCALMGPSYHVLNDATDLTPGGAELWFDPRKGSDKTFLKALSELAANSGHQEVATVPWCLWGHSGGGIWSNVMSMLHPSRVVAVFLRSGTAAMFRSRAEFPRPEVPNAIYAIPTMVNVGVGEKGKVPWGGSIATFQEYRAKGAPIGFAPDPRTGHECGDSRYLAIPFFDACLGIRLPDRSTNDAALKLVDLSSVWLAPFMGEMAVPAAEFKGDPKEAVWLPNSAVAQAWREYLKTGTVSDSTPPRLRSTCVCQPERIKESKSLGMPRRTLRAGSAASSCCATDGEWRDCRRIRQSRCSGVRSSRGSRITTRQKRRSPRCSTWTPQPSPA